MDKFLNSRGQSLFEVVLALGVISLVLITIVSLTLVSVKNTNSTRNRSLATRLSQDTKEWLTIEKAQGWTAFVGRASVATRCMPDLNWSTAGIGSCNAGSQSDNVAGTIFDRQLSLSTNDQQTQVLANVAISWSDSEGFHQINSSTIFENWR